MRRELLLQALLERALVVVRAVLQTADDVGGGRVELQVVDLTGDWVSAAKADALHENAVRHFELDKGIGLDSDVSHGLGLGGSAGEAVEEPALRLDLRLAQLGLHHADDNAVRNKGALGHVLLGLLAEGSAGLDLLAQDIAGADVHDAVRPGDELALCACRYKVTRGTHSQCRSGRGVGGVSRTLAAAWSAGDDDLGRAVALVVDSLEQLSRDARHVVLEGGAGGALAGAAIGAIAGDAGKGAAIGATSLGLTGGVRSRRAVKTAGGATDAAVATYQQQFATWNRNFMVAMEAKGYTIR